MRVAVGPGEWEILAADGKVYAMSGDSPEHACERVADLYRVTIVAWREPRIALVIGLSRHAAEVIG
jgi:hypothetical protein